MMAQAYSHAVVTIAAARWGHSDGGFIDPMQVRLRDRLRLWKSSKEKYLVGFNWFFFPGELIITSWLDASRTRAFNPNYPFDVVLYHIGVPRAISFLPYDIQA